MRFVPIELPDVVRIVPTVHEDARGHFMETWQARRFFDAGIDLDFVQDNVSKSSKGTLRGPHFQIEQAQGRLMRVVSGDVFDVAVDLRRSSPNFGKWVGEIFSADNKHQLWVPPGFGHGFLILIKTAMFVYKRVDYYAPEFERSVRRNDPEIGIDWPLEKDEQPVLSPKDREAPLLRDADTYQ